MKKMRTFMEELKLRREFSKMMKTLRSWMLTMKKM